MLAALLAVLIDVHSFDACRQVARHRYDGFDGVSHAWTAECQSGTSYRLWLREGLPVTLDRCDNWDAWMASNGFAGRCWPGEPTQTQTPLKARSSPCPKTFSPIHPPIKSKP